MSSEIWFIHSLSKSESFHVRDYYLSAWAGIWTVHSNTIRGFVPGCACLPLQTPLCQPLSTWIEASKTSSQRRPTWILGGPFVLRTMYYVPCTMHTLKILYYSVWCTVSRKLLNTGVSSVEQTRRPCAWSRRRGVRQELLQNSTPSGEAHDPLVELWD